jgi:hypothetical protein
LSPVCGAWERREKNRVEDEMRRKETCGKRRARVFAASWLEAASWLKVLAVENAAKETGGKG